jgi:hypothetical protein
VPSPPQRLPPTGALLPVEQDVKLLAFAVLITAPPKTLLAAGLTLTACPAVNPKTGQSPA